MVKIEYKTEQEKMQLLEQYDSQGYALIGESNITEGDFLTFMLREELPEIEPEPEKPMSELEILQKLQKRVEEQQQIIDAILGVTE